MQGAFGQLAVARGDTSRTSGGAALSERVYLSPSGPLHYDLGVRIVLARVRRVVYRGPRRAERAHG